MNRSTKRDASKLKRAPAKRLSTKKPHVAVAAKAGKLKEKSATEVAATHLKSLPYELGHLIPSAWWRHGS